MNKLYRNQLVRDLVWVISSPSLFEFLPYQKGIQLFNQEIFDSEFNSLQKFINRLDLEPAILTEHIQIGNNRLLGKYFESLCEFWFLHSKRFKLINKSVQINHSGDTKGELDFILKDNLTEQYIHLETAGKFYISSENSKSWETFIGPNPNDNLKQKMDKLFNEQILLTQNKIVREYLHSLGIENINTAVLIKGYLFYPLKNFLLGNISIPDFANPNHNRGWWIRFGEVEKLFDLNSDSWIILQRMNWVSKAIISDENDIYNTETLLAFLQGYFEFNHYPLLIASMKKIDDFFVETSRGFVVSDLWPDLNFIH